jgi:hypothetical protein
MTESIRPAATDAAVRALLASVLRDASFAGRDELLNQVAAARVTGGPMTMLALSVEKVPPCHSCPDGPAPLSAVVNDVGGEPIGELLIRVKDGYLSGLEFAWWGDAHPQQLPAPSQVQVAP